MKPSEIKIPVEGSYITGDLQLVPHSSSLVIFAHGSGSSRFSKRNQFVANVLNQSQISTFLFDLLTPEEDEIDQYTRQFRFDIPRLADRLIIVTEWIKAVKKTQDMHIGYFGSSTGAAAALIAAAKKPEEIHAVVSRGGRTDLAKDYLENVQAATLLIVGEFDYDVIRLNKMTHEQLNCTKDLTIIPGATHLFEEPGALEKVAHIAAKWFATYL